MKISLAAVVEPDNARHKVLAQGLKKAGLKVSAARTPDALRKEHLVVLGSSLKAAARVAREVRKRSPQALLLAAQSKGFKAAFADGVLPLPVSPNDLRVRLIELAAGQAAATAPIPAPRPGEGILDPITNFYTFAHFKEVLFVEVKRARRYGFPLALALVAFDPQASPPIDAELQEQLMGGLALSVRRSLRDTDYPVQFSKDRVVLLMPHTDLAGALIVARRIVERVAKATLQRGEETLRPTISVGVAAGAPGKEYGFSDLVRQAQDGLTAAMARGGSRVEFMDAEQHLADGPTLVPAATPPMS